MFASRLLTHIRSEYLLKTIAYQLHINALILIIKTKILRGSCTIRIKNVYKRFNFKPYYKTPKNPAIMQSTKVRCG
jgi:hypothetical protein